MGVKIGNIDVTFKVGSADCAVYLGDTLVYSGTTPTHDYSLDYLTFVAEEDGTFSFNSSGMSYSLDDGATWTELASGGTTPTVSSGDSILWKSTITPSSNGIGTFNSSSNFIVEGNAMSLLFGDNFSGQTDLTGKNYVFKNLFKRCAGMTSAENLVLPATTLASSCYGGMFQGCTSLTTAPSLPATTLAESCYENMFNNCRSLTTAPQLPATTLTNQCYANMFASCSSLTTAPQLPATTLAEWCYSNMFYDCRNLETAPQLPATTLAESCYNTMFYGCSSLNSITCLATDISASNCTSNWLSGVAASGTFTKAASMSSWTTGRSGIPSGWTVVDYSG